MSDWIKFPHEKIGGIGPIRLRKLEIIMSDFFPEYSTLIIPEGTLLTTGKVEKTILYIRKKDK